MNNLETFTTRPSTGAVESHAAAEAARSAWSKPQSKPQQGEKEYWEPAKPAAPERDGNGGVKVPQSGVGELKSDVKPGGGGGGGAHGAHGSTEHLGIPAESGGAPKLKSGGEAKSGRADSGEGEAAHPACGGEGKGIPAGPQGDKPLLKTKPGGASADSVPDVHGAKGNHGLPRLIIGE